jgi:hypothetical protein
MFNINELNLKLENYPTGNVNFKYSIYTYLINMQFQKIKAGSLRAAESEPAISHN